MALETVLIVGGAAAVTSFVTWWGVRSADKVNEENVESKLKEIKDKITVSASDEITTTVVKRMDAQCDAAFKKLEKRVETELMPIGAKLEDNAVKMFRQLEGSKVEFEKQIAEAKQEFGRQITEAKTASAEAKAACKTANDGLDEVRSLGAKFTEIFTRARAQEERVEVVVQGAERAEARQLEAANRATRLAGDLQDKMGAMSMVIGGAQKTIDRIDGKAERIIAADALIEETMAKAEASATAAATAATANLSAKANLDQLEGRIDKMIEKLAMGQTLVAAQPAQPEAQPEAKPAQPAKKGRGQQKAKTATQTGPLAAGVEETVEAS